MSLQMKLSGLGYAYLGAFVLGRYSHTMINPNRMWCHVGSPKVTPRIDSYAEGSSIQQPPEMVNVSI